MMHVRLSIVVVAAAAPLLVTMTSVAQITFVPGDQIPVSSGPAFVATGDFNNDGFQDAVVSHTISDKVAVLLGSPNGFRSPPVSIPVGSVLRGVTTLNANGDLNLDIAVTAFSPSRVYVISGNGNGTFGTPQPFDADRRGAIAVASGNFDDQNGSDLVTANGPANTITVFISQPGNSGFVAQNDLPVGNNPRAVATGDFDSNGLADIVVVDTGSRGTDELALLLNDDSGSFQDVNAVNFLVGKSAIAVAVADFNNDGISDVAVLNQGQIGPGIFTISVLLTQTRVTSAGRVVGTGSFTVTPPFPIACPPRINGIAVNCVPQDIRVADFDGDGFRDLAVSFSTAGVDNSSTTAGFVSAYAGRGDGSFDFGLPVVVGLRPRQIAAADFTGDHIPDLIVTEEGNNTVRILRGVVPPKKLKGRVCTADTQCDSNFCTDGVCCANNTCPATQSCNIPNFEGDCALPGLNGNRCSTNQQCVSGTCVDDFCCASASCSDGSFCTTGVCGPPGENGTSCSEAPQCVSGFCVDRTCCASPACGFGQFCDISGHKGMCSQPAPNGVHCNAPEQCQTNLCTDHVCCVAESCVAGLTCNAPGHEGACFTIPPPTPTATATPTPQPNGARCTNRAQCVSSACVAGVCCALQASQTSCPTNQFCNVTGHFGICSPRGSSGDSCRLDTDCVSLNCQSGTICADARTPAQTLAATRTPTPGTGLGRPCDPNNPEACDSGLCTNNVCCSATDCPAPMRCDIFGQAGDCAFPLDAGQDCEKTSDCATGLVCSFNIELNHKVCSLPPTPTRPLPPLPTPTPVAAMRIGSARGIPGDTIPVTVSLSASEVGIAATANDIAFSNTALSVDPKTCQLKRSIPKSLVASVLDQGGGVGLLRVFVQSRSNTDVIAAGPLYTCEFRISSSAFPGIYGLTSSAVAAFTPAGAQIPFVGGSNGSITVSLLPLACPGDCDTNGTVTVDEVLTLVNIALSGVEPSACVAGDSNRDRKITIDEVLAAVNSVLSNCL